MDQRNTELSTRLNDQLNSPKGDPHKCLISASLHQCHDSQPNRPVQLQSIYVGKFRQNTQQNTK